MKKLSILSVAAFLVLSCKKDNGVTESPSQYMVSSLAGSGVAGSVDGPAATAQFNGPTKIVVDNAGNVYVSDNTRFSIRKITKDGTVTTLAGGSKGTADGDGTGAEFMRLGSLTVDAQNNIYVVDSTRIRKITPAGKVSTFAGGLTAGHINGAGTAAQFDQIFSITVDKQGNVYALEHIPFDSQPNVSVNSQIRKITPSGVVTTFIDTTQKFDKGGILPNNYDLAVDANGNLFVTRSGFLEYYIYKITPAKNVSLFASTPDISGITISPATDKIYISGTTLVCSSIYSCINNYKIYKVSSAGNVTIAGGESGFADGAGNVARFGYSAGIAIDTQGNIYVADALNNRIRKISKP